MHQEREDIGKLFNLHGSRFAKPMTCLPLDAYQNWSISALTGLQASCKFEGMTWHDAIVMVSGKDQRGGVSGPRL